MKCGVIIAMQHESNIGIVTKSEEVVIDFQGITPDNLFKQVYMKTYKPLQG